MHLVLFDIDGTLTQTGEVDNRCYLCALGEALRTTYISSDWASYPNVTDSGIAAALWEACYGAPPSRQQLDAVCQRFVALLGQEFARNPDVCRAVPGAAAILAELARRADFTVGLATGGWLESARLKLHHAGLGGRTFPLATASDASSREAIMTLAAERVAAHWGVLGFQSIVYVGDAVWDIKAARRLGWHFVGIGSEGSAERLRREGAQWVFADYHDQREFFNAIAQYK
jgi:phosphoglycolate phosphatase-like HAD superfamily hydrolase